MKNAVVSPVSQFYNNIGNNELHMPYLDVHLMQMESRDRNSLESKIFNNDDQLRDGAFAFAIPHQSHNFNFDLQQDFPSGNSNCDNSFQQSMSFTNKLALPQFETDIQNLQNGRKRTIEADDQMQLNGNCPLNELKNNNKRRKLSSFQQQQPHPMTKAVAEIKECKFHMPAVRRSQKLSDKITALQKLVSPYGKTDTASVLQEASLYIKLLQEQIQNLFRMLSSSYNSLRAIHPQENGKRQPDLRSRGLCLVPISYTQKVTKQDRIDTNNSISRKTIIPRKF